LLELKVCYEGRFRRCPVPGDDSVMLPDGQLMCITSYNKIVYMPLSVLMTPGRVRRRRGAAATDRHATPRPVGRLCPL
jgi:hypothetical protein